MIVLYMWNIFCCYSSSSSVDARLRRDGVELYNALWGRLTPSCVPPQGVSVRTGFSLSASVNFRQLATTPSSHSSRKSGSEWPWLSVNQKKCQVFNREPDSNVIMAKSRSRRQSKSLLVACWNLLFDVFITLSGLGMIPGISVSTPFSLWIKLLVNTQLQVYQQYFHGDFVSYSSKILQTWVA